MKLVYGISRWTNPHRASARHIDNGEGKPLCNSGRKAYWQREEGEPTCKRCIAKYKKLTNPLDRGILIDLEKYCGECGEKKCDNCTIPDARKSTEAQIEKDLRRNQ